MKNLDQAVVVITGASSGIGHAAALKFADSGARLVLAARRENVLEEVARDCRNRGAKVIVAPTDVTDEEAVKKLAERAYAEFGRIDVWVNNAAVTLFSRFEEAPAKAYRRVIETNFFGYVNGARAVLPYFREQGEGTLINVNSIVSSAPQPYTSAYVASKYAIRGFTECLRMELSLDEVPHIIVCTIMPASIDTPLFSNAANYTGRGVKALNPVYSAHKIARAIVSAAKNPKRERIVGEAGRPLAIGHAVAPGIYEKLAARMVDNDHFKDEPAPSGEGNLFMPSDHTGISDGWRDRQVLPMQAHAASVAFLAVAAGLIWLAVKR